MENQATPSVEESKKYLVDFFEKVWPEVSEAAKAIWGVKETTGRFTGKIICPKDGELIVEPFVEKAEWENATRLINFCKICGKKVKKELSAEHLYEFKWRDKTLEMVFDPKIYEKRMKFLKGEIAQEEEIADASPKA